MKDVVTAKGNAKHSSGKKVCTGMSIDIAANGGFSVRKQYRMESTGKGDYPGYVEPETYAFGSYAELETWLKKTLS